MTGPATLAYRALGLGDLLTAVPALRALAAGRGPLSLAAPGWLAPVAELLGMRLLAAGPLAPLPPAALRPELAVNLHGRGPQSTALLAAAGPGRLWAYAGPGTPEGPPWDPEEHEVDRWCRLLRWYGLHPDRADLLLPAPPAGLLAAVPAGATLVHPGGSAAARRWPAERWAAVVAGLQARGHQVLVSAGPGERERAERVLTAAGTGRLWTGGLGCLCALVAQARLVLCSDTGVGHLATAYARPSVILFGPVPPSRWGPPPDGPHLSLGGEEPSDPFAATPAPALLAVTPDQVLGAVDRQATLAG